MMKRINSNPEKIAKVKETWRKKREDRWDSLYPSTAKHWYKEEVGERCEICQIEEWNGKRLPLEVHHLDGNNKNNKKENLQVLCPNCHAQTDSWRKKK
jgi:heterodisulfide reductase subunit B